MHASQWLEWRCLQGVKLALICFGRHVHVQAPVAPKTPIIATLPNVQDFSYMAGKETFQNSPNGNQTICSSALLCARSDISSSINAMIRHRYWSMGRWTKESSRSCNENNPDQTHNWEDDSQVYNYIRKLGKWGTHFPQGPRDVWSSPQVIEIQRPPCIWAPEMSRRWHQKARDIEENSRSRITQRTCKVELGELVAIERSERCSYPTNPRHTKSSLTSFGPKNGSETPAASLLILAKNWGKEESRCFTYTKLRTHMWYSGSDQHTKRRKEGYKPTIRTATSCEFNE